MVGFTSYSLSVLTCLLAGLVMLVGSMLMLYKGVLKLNAEKQDTEVQVPGGFSFSTHYPALVLFGIGAALLLLPLYLTSRNPTMALPPASVVTDALDPDEPSAIDTVLRASSIQDDLAVPMQSYSPR